MVFISTENILQVCQGVFMKTLCVYSCDQSKKYVTVTGHHSVCVCVCVCVCMCVCVLLTNLIESSWYSVWQSHRCTQRRIPIFSSDASRNCSCYMCVLISLFLLELFWGSLFFFFEQMAISCKSSSRKSVLSFSSGYFWHLNGYLGCYSDFEHQFNQS